MPWKRPYDDGVPTHLRKKLRMDAWRCNPNIGRKKRLRATEVMCPKCGNWAKVADEETWCEHMKRTGEPVDGPNVQTFTPYYNPNIQEGGAWIATKAKENLAMKICGKEPMF